MLIAVDHGNKQIKTNHRTFTSSFCVSSTRPPFGKDVLFYKNKYYTLSDQRIPYMRDPPPPRRVLRSEAAVPQPPAVWTAMHPLFTIWE